MQKKKIFLMFFFQIGVQRRPARGQRNQNGDLVQRRQLEAGRGGAGGPSL